MGATSSSPFRVQITQPLSCGALSFTAQSIGAIPNAWGPTGCKHLSLGKIGGRWYKVCGDHEKVDPNSPDLQDGRQEIFSFTTTANDWRLDQPYWLPAGQVQFWNPDDAFCCVRKGEIWGWRSTGVLSFPPNNIPDGVATQLNAACAWTPGGTWREAGPLPHGITENRAWHAIYYEARDVFVIPSAAGYNATISVQNGEDGADLTLSDSGGNVYSPLDVATFGDSCDWRVAGGFIRSDELYLFDMIYKQIIAINLPLWLDWKVGDPIPANVARKVCDVPVPFTLGTQSAISLVWHEASDQMMLFTGSVLLVTATSNPSSWTQVTRQDGYPNANGNMVYAAKQYYDRDDQLVLSIATIDWEASTPSGLYWLIKCG